MTKIKNFRITLRPRDMARWLKKERGLETTPEVEVLVEKAAKDAKPLIETAAIYTTLTRQVAEKTMDLSFPPKAIAVTVIAVSVGAALEAKRSAETDPSQESLLAALQQEALSQSIHFVTRLAEDQAKEEDCETSSPVPAQEPPVASSLGALLGVQRIGIVLDASSPAIPPHVRLAWLFWIPLRKAAARKPEKVAA